MCASRVGTAEPPWVQAEDAPCDRTGQPHDRAEIEVCRVSTASDAKIAPKRLVVSLRLLWIGRTLLSRVPGRRIRVGLLGCFDGGGIWHIPSCSLRSLSDGGWELQDEA